MTAPLKVYALYCALVVFALVMFALADSRAGHWSFRKARWSLRRSWFWAGGILSIGGAVALLARYSEPIHFADDFLKAYYPAGRAVLDNPATLYAREHSGDLRFVNVPIVAVLFAPFAGLAEKFAAGVFTALGVAAVALSYAGLVRLTGVSGWRAAALAALIAVNGPLWYSFREGNLTHFILPLLVGALGFAIARRDAIAGCCLAAAGLIKIPLFLLAAYFLLRGRWRVIGGLSATLLATMGLSVALFGVDLHLVWWRDCIDLFAGRALTAYNSQSLHAFLARCLTAGPLDSWEFVDVGAQFGLINKGILAGLALATILACWRAPSSKAGEATEYSIVLCLALIASPLSWTHYFLYMLIPIGLYLGNMLTVPTTAPWIAAIGASALLMSPPVFLVTDGLPAWSRPLASHCFFGALLMFGTLLSARWRSGGMAALALPVADETKADRARLAAA
jgi:hypothetical protein